MAGVGRIRRALTSASPGYILERVGRELRRMVYDRLRLWRGVARRVDRRITADDLAAPDVAFGGLLAEDACTAARRLIAQAGLGPAFQERAADARQRRLAYFGSDLPVNEPWPWLKDWKHGHEWPVGPAGAINHFAPRSTPYDPKFPFELSRLAFVVHVLAAALVAESDELRGDLQSFALGVLADWDEHNPLGETLNWYAMEASVRAVALVQILDLARVGGVQAEGLALIARLVARCAHYVEINIEWAIESNNHLIGNLTCLALAGYALRDIYPDARRWFWMAKRDLPAELLRQFHEDGGNFEGSLPYHLATTDLALLADLALERAGSPLPAEVRARLGKACAFAIDVAAPDGRIPIIGDCDDSRHLLFDLIGPLDVANLGAFGTARFGFANGHAAPEALLSVAFLLGSAGIEAVAAPGTSTGDLVRRFPNTGIIVIRSGRSYLVQDVGGVGQNGHGGHGHNDLTSFVFSLDGHPVLVDRGSGVYSSDPVCRDKQRSSYAHSLLMLDEEEIAELGPTLFQIQDQARPEGVSLELDGEGCWRTRIAHTGYARLSPPALTERTIWLEPVSGALRCEDVVRSAKIRPVTRRFHFDPAIVLSLDERGHAASFSVGGRAWRASWNCSKAQVECVDHFFAYGQAVPAPCLVLSSSGADERLWFSIHEA